MKKKPGDNCPYCLRQLTVEVFEKKNSLRKEAIRKGLRESDEMLGRPRSIDYSEVYKLRNCGLSIRKIADYFDVSRGSIQHALKILKSKHQSSTN